MTVNTREVRRDTEMMTGKTTGEIRGDTEMRDREITPVEIRGHTEIMREGQTTGETKGGTERMRDRKITTVEIRTDTEMTTTIGEVRIETGIVTGKATTRGETRRGREGEVEGGALRTNFRDQRRTRRISIRATTLPR